MNQNADGNTGNAYVQALLDKGVPFACLINTASNEDLLRNAPHKEWNDLSVIVRYRLKDDRFGSVSTIAGHDLFRALGATFDEIYPAALENTKKAIQICDLSGLSILPEGSKEGPAALILYGGVDCPYMDGGLLFPDILKDAALRLNADRIAVLPSSVHELIAVKLTDDIAASDLAGVVRSVNEEQVSEREFLSDSVYVYAPSAGVVEVW